VRKVRDGKVGLGLRKDGILGMGWCGFAVCGCLRDRAIYLQISCLVSFKVRCSRVRFGNMLDIQV
jgi:hypothetical protein